MRVQYRILNWHTMLVIAMSAFRAPLVSGDTLTANPRAVSLTPREPIVVDLVYRLESRLPPARTPRGLADSDSRIPRRFYAVVAQGGDCACRFNLYGAPSRPLAAEERSEFKGIAIGFMTPYDESTRERVYFERPGRYTLTVHGGGLVSEPIELAIREPRGDEIHALGIWRGVGLIGTVSMVLEQKGSPEVIDAFRKLATDYKHTPYGRYALASMALWDFKQAVKEFNNEGGATVWEPVARQLREALVDGIPLLRKKTLMNLASAETLARNYDGARQAMAKVQAEFSDEATQIQARDFLNFLATQRSHPKKTASDR